jgi:hypothetical protein
MSQGHARSRLRLHRRIRAAAAAAGRFPPAVAAELQTIGERLAKLEALPEDAWTDGLASESEDLQERHDELVETTEADAVYAQEDRARAGVIVTTTIFGSTRASSNARHGLPTPAMMPRRRRRTAPPRSCPAPTAPAPPLAR